jgi:hypothetical protein
MYIVAKLYNLKYLKYLNARKLRFKMAKLRRNFCLVAKMNIFFHILKNVKKCSRTT